MICSIPAQLAAPSSIAVTPEFVKKQSLNSNFLKIENVRHR